METKLGAGGTVVTGKLRTLEVPPAEASLSTVTAMLPGVGICDAVTCAVNCVAESYVVGMAEPFQSTFAVGEKLLPVTVSWKLAPPAIKVDGASEVMAGAVWSVIVNCRAADPASPWE